MLPSINTAGTESYLIDIVWCLLVSPCNYRQLSSGALGGARHPRQWHCGEFHAVVVNALSHPAGFHTDCCDRDSELCQVFFLPIYRVFAALLLPIEPGQSALGDWSVGDSHYMSTISINELSSWCDDGFRHDIYINVQY